MSGYSSGMRTVPLAEAKDKLSGLVDEAETTHEIITITRHGRAAAVLMSADDLESLHETLAWLSKHDTREAVAAAEREYAAGETTSGEDLRAELRLPAR
jgi:antitoxin YefM